MVVLPVFTVNRYRPSWEISTQQGAVSPSAKGEPVIDFTFAFGFTENADTDPLSVPPCAFDTYRWCGSAGENALPNGPAASAGNGEPAAGVSRPSAPTMKLSIRNVLGSVVPTSTPIRFLPVPLNRMSPGRAVGGSGIVEPASGVRRPSSASLNPV